MCSCLKPCLANFAEREVSASPNGTLPRGPVPQCCESGTYYSSSSLAAVPTFPQRQQRAQALLCLPTHVESSLIASQREGVASTGYISQGWLCVCSSIAVLGCYGCVLVSRLCSRTRGFRRTLIGRFSGARELVRIEPSTRRVGIDKKYDSE